MHLVSGSMANGKLITKKPCVVSESHNGAVTRSKKGKSRMEGTFLRDNYIVTFLKLIKELGWAFIAILKNHFATGIIITECMKLRNHQKYNNLSR